MAERKKLTNAIVSRLQAPEKGRRSVYDTIVPSLNITITEKGSRSWYVYRSARGRPIRKFLGRFPQVLTDQARELAREVVFQIETGKPLGRTKERTFGDLWKWYYENHSLPHKSSHKRDEQRYRDHLQDLRSKLLSDITTADLQSLHSRIGKRSGIHAANDSLKLVRTMFSKAIANEWIEKNPVSGVKMFRTESRERFLQGEELPRFFEAVNGLKNQTTRDFLFTCLFTGARRSNVAAMRWEEIDLDREIWIIPGEKSKNRKPITVTLSKEATEILRIRKEVAESPEWVFPGRGKTGHFTEPYGSWKLVRERADLKDIRIHDLRRTLASWQAAAGSSLIVIGKSLGHESQKSSEIYARLDLDPVRESVKKATDLMIKAARQEKK